MTKVTLISSVDRGGGGLAASRLHKGFLEAGMTSQFFCRSAATALEHTQKFIPPSGRIFAAMRMYRRWKKKRLEKDRRRDASQLWGMDHLSRFGASAALQIPEADVWNLHSVFDLFDYDALFRAASPETLIVWTLHHMTPLTGGCCYSQSCRRFEQSCGQCQYLQSTTDVADASHQAWQSKKTIYDRIPSNQLAIVTPSHWLADCVSKSSLLGNRPVHVIPYGLDLELFKAHDPLMARKALGIPLNSRVVLFVSQFDRTTHIKGFIHLEKALALLTHNSDLVCVSVGPPNGARQISGIPLIEAGAIEQQWIMPLIYSAADLLVVPSLEDNFPNVILEASACGIPVVGTRAGGIPEMIDDQITGLLVPKADHEALAAAVQTLLDQPKTRHRMSLEGRARCLREFAMKTQVQRYQEVFAAGVAELARSYNRKRI